MSKKKLEKYLDTLDASQLRDIIMDMYQSRKEMRDYLEFFLNPDSERLATKYRDAIRREFISRAGYIKRHPRRSVCKRAIAEMLTFSPDPMVMADVMLGYIHFALEAIRLTGQSEQFTSSVAKSFADTMRYIVNHSLTTELASSVEHLLDEAQRRHLAEHQHLKTLWSDLSAL